MQFHTIVDGRRIVAKHVVSPSSPNLSWFGEEGPFCRRGRNTYKTSKLLDGIILYKLNKSIFLIQYGVVVEYYFSYYETHPTRAALHFKNAVV